MVSIQIYCILIFLFKNFPQHKNRELKFIYYSIPLSWTFRPYLTRIPLSWAFRPYLTRTQCLSCVLLTLYSMPCFYLIFKCMYVTFRLPNFFVFAVSCIFNVIPKFYSFLFEYIPLFELGKITFISSLRFEVILFFGVWVSNIDIVVYNGVLCKGNSKLLKQ